MYKQCSLLSFRHNSWLQWLITVFSAMTPLEYVSKHISITSGCKLLYNTVFNRHKRDADEEEDADTLDRRISGEVGIFQVLKHRYYFFILDILVTE